MCSYDKCNICKGQIKEPGGCRWKAFLKKKKALVDAELEDVVDLLRMLLLPIVENITGNNDYSAKWDHESRSWK